MTTLGYSSSEIIAAVTPVVTGIDSGQEPLEVFARAAWSTLVEPGEKTSGQLIASLGAVGSLDAVIGSRSATKICSQMELTPDQYKSFLPDLDSALKGWRSRTDSHRVLSVLEHAAGIDAFVVTPLHHLWPEGLTDLQEHSPVLLWARGQEQVLERFRHSVAVVGARASTGYGEHVTTELVSGLVTHSQAIVSGAAYGIDGMAHRTALAAEGTTMAFLAGGVDRFYPSGHDALLGRLCSTGLVLSELPCGAAPTKWRFLMRNRLIAASTQATVVVEAGWRSGSLNTANHAATLGRPLGVVPGPVTSAASAGCHRLLREYDATCVTNAEEIMQLLNTA